MVGLLAVYTVLAVALPNEYFLHPAELWSVVAFFLASAVFTLKHELDEHLCSSNHTSRVADRHSPSMLIKTLPQSSPTQTTHYPNQH
jgi:hypothetical protein